MGIDWQISFASRTLYFLAIIALVHVVTGGSWLATWMLGSGFADIGSVYVSAGNPLAGYALEIIAIASFCALGYSVSLRYLWAMNGALWFLVADGLALFDRAAAVGAPAAGIGLLASFLVVFHGIVWWCVFRAARASRQYRVNSAIVERLRFEAELKRRLAESDEPPPPAAKFETRFRGMPPGAQPPLGAA